MITLSTAKKLKSKGLIWIPALHDFFAIPYRGLEDRIFVISDMMAYMEIRNNLPVVTFHGVVEWALDHLLTKEVVWMPREEQLRTKLMHHLISEDQPVIKLENIPEGYRCEIRYQAQTHLFQAQDASEAYAAALLFLLEVD